MLDRRGTFKSILTVGAPLLISQMSQYLMTIADTAMVGRLGRIPLAGVSIGSTTAWLLFVFVWPVSIGVQVIAARRFGANETGVKEIKPLRTVFGAGLFYTGIASVLSLSVSAIAGPVFRSVLSEPEVARGALDYLKFIRWCVPLIGISGSVQGLMNAMRRTRQVMVITAAANVLNVFLNWIFIFGNLGMPQMGLVGAGLATLISQIAQAAALLVLMLFSPTLSDIRKESIKPEIGLLKKVAEFSLPVAVQNGLAILIILVFDMVVENLGTIYLAVTQIVFSFYRINKTIVGGFARGAGILAGNALGADDPDGARRVTRIQQTLGLVIGLLVMLIVLTIPEVLVRLFTDDSEVVILGAKVLRFFAAFFLVEISAFSLEIIFQSVGWSRFVLFSEFTTNVLFILGATLILVRFTGMGIWGAWTGFALYQVGHAAILGFGWMSGKWLKTRVEN